jgi:hypothetical protein
LLILFSSVYEAGLFPKSSDWFYSKRVERVVSISNPEESSVKRCALFF